MKLKVYGSRKPVEIPDEYIPCLTEAHYRRIGFPFEDGATIDENDLVAEAINYGIINPLPLGWYVE